jgi:hypothetical protein
MLAGNATIVDWLELIKGEYQEVPGLKLTTHQVQRLWGLDRVQCDSLLAALVDAKILRRTVDHRYVRADAG